MGQGFRELRVWKDAKAIAVEVYRLIQKSSELNKDWGLKNQMQRAAVSIPSNIAEGDARKSDKDSVRFFHIALGSLAELVTQIEIAMELGFIQKHDYLNLIKRIEQLSQSLGALIKSRRSATNV